LGQAIEPPVIKSLGKKRIAVPQSGQGIRDVFSFLSFVNFLNSSSLLLSLSKSVSSSIPNLLEQVGQVKVSPFRNSSVFTAISVEQLGQGMLLDIWFFD
jgi:hypothetical protein